MSENEVFSKAMVGNERGGCLKIAQLTYAAKVISNQLVNHENYSSCFPKDDPEIESKYWTSSGTSVKLSWQSLVLLKGIKQASRSRLIP